MKDRNLETRSTKGGCNIHRLCYCKPL